MLILVSDRRDFATSLAEALVPHGIFSLCASHETARFLCEAKDCGGALLDGVPDPHVAEELCRDLRKSYPDLPIALLIPDGYVPHAQADRLLRQENPDALLLELLPFCRTVCGWCTEKLTSFSLTVGGDPQDTRYMGYPLPLPPREHILLRCLFYRAPRLTSPDDLLAMCYPGRAVSAASLSVMISEINRRAASIDPRPLILNAYGKGYRLRSGILDLPS